MMLHAFLEKGPWFRAKKFGYGTGLPLKRQGWVLIGFYLLTLAGTGQLSAQAGAISRAGAFVLFLVVTAIFLMICHAKTEGGWKWRGGGNA